MGVSSAILRRSRSLRSRLTGFRPNVSASFLQSAFPPTLHHYNPSSEVRRPCSPLNDLNQVEFTCRSRASPHQTSAGLSDTTKWSSYLGTGLESCPTATATAYPRRAQSSAAVTLHIHPLSRLPISRSQSNLPSGGTVYGGPKDVQQAKAVTLRHLNEKYAKKEPISMVTAYDYPSAVHVDRVRGAENDTVVIKR